MFVWCVSRFLSRPQTERRIPAVNFCWLSFARMKQCGANCIVCLRRCRVWDRCLKEALRGIKGFPLMEKKPLPSPTVSFDTCRQSNSSQNTFCFQSGSLTRCWKREVCVCVCVLDVAGRITFHAAHACSHGAWLRRGEQHPRFLRA